MRMITKILVFLGVCLTAYFNGRVSADTPLALTKTFKNMGTLGFTDVQTESTKEALWMPRYKDAPAHVPEHLSFHGWFYPDATTTSLAVLSDDGVDVYINGKRVLNNLDKGQAMPDIAHSLYQLTYTPTVGQPDEILINYSNIVYTGDGDIDGVTLFAYNGGGQVSNDPICLAKVQYQYCANPYADSPVSPASLYIPQGQLINFKALSNATHGGAWPPGYTPTWAFNGDASGVTLTSTLGATTSATFSDTGTYSLKTTLTSNGVTSSIITNISVVSVSLDMDSLAQAQKLFPGAFINVGEMKPLSLSLQPETLTAGQLTLTWDATRVNIWLDAEKTQPLCGIDDTTTTPTPINAGLFTWTIGQDMLPQTLYVEALTPSVTQGDTQLSLHYLNDGCDVSDALNLTIVGTSLSMTGLDASRNMTPGALLACNGQPVTVKLGYPSFLAYGTVTLTAPPEVIVTDQNNQPLTLPMSWDLSSSTLPPTTVHVQGSVTPSTAMPGGAISLCYANNDFSTNPSPYINVTVTQLSITPVSNIIDVGDGANFATGYSANTGDVAVVQASVTPSCDTLNALLQWNNGIAITTGSNTQHISRNTSGSTILAVSLPTLPAATVVTRTAWVVKVSLGIAGLSDTLKDTAPGAIIHVDPDATVLGPDANARMTPFTITLSPSGLPGGIVSFPTIPQTSIIKVYAQSNKTEYKASILPVDLSISAPPSQYFLEGVAPSITPQQITLNYNWGTLSLSDAVCATVDANAGTPSSATLRIFDIDNEDTYSDDDTIDPDDLGGESYNPIGGRKAVALTFTVGSFEQLDPSIYPKIAVQVRDNYAYPSDASAMYNWPLDLSSATGWQEQQSDGSWQPATDIPSALNTDDNPHTFMALLNWNTRTTPGVTYTNAITHQISSFTPSMGHNDAHTITLVVNGLPEGILAFQPLGETSYEAGPDDKSAMVKNLIITNLNSSNGSVDYLKYDSIPSNQSNHRPSVSFAFDDNTTGKIYHCYVLIEPTGLIQYNVPTAKDILSIFNYTYMSPSNDPQSQPITANATWNGSIYDPDLKSQGIYQLTGPDHADWGTYTYDVLIEAYDTNGNMVDWTAYKWPYDMTFNESVKVIQNQSESAISQQLRAFYNYIDSCAIANENALALNPNSAIPYPNDTLPSDTNLIVVDNALNTYQPEELDQNPNSLDLHDGSDHQGLIMKTQIPGLEYTFPSIFNGWRTIFTGQSNNFKNYRRDHISTRLLACNTFIPNATALTDYQYANVLICLIAMYDNMNNIEVASKTNARNLTYVPFFGTNIPIKFTLPKSIVKELASNCLQCYLFARDYVNHSSGYEGWENTQALRIMSKIFIDEDDEQGACNYDPFINWQIYLGDWTNDSLSVIATLTHELQHATHFEQGHFTKFIYGDIVGRNYEIQGNIKTKSSYDGTNGQVGVGLTYFAADEIDGFPPGSAIGASYNQLLPGGLITRIFAPGIGHRADLIKALRSITDFRNKSTVAIDFLDNYVLAVGGGIDDWVINR